MIRTFADVPSEPHWLGALCEHWIDDKHHWLYEPVEGSTTEIVNWLRNRGFAKSATRLKTQSVGAIHITIVINKTYQLQITRTMRMQPRRAHRKAIK